MMQNSKVIQYLKDPLRILMELETQFSLYAAYHREKNPSDEDKAKENKKYAQKAGVAIRDLSELQAWATTDGFGHNYGVLSTAESNELCQTNETTSTASLTFPSPVWSYENLQKVLLPSELNWLKQRIAIYLKEQARNQQSKVQ